MTEQLHCLIRKKWVAAHPEEKVRQQLLAYMVNHLAYPASHLVLERGLRQMPHLELKSQEIPERRADLICFAKDIHPQHSLYPLLLVECKSEKLTPAVIHQVVGYNHFLQAYFISIANGESVKTGWINPTKGEYQFIDGLPPYSELLKRAK